ncbi:hypothetical protein ACWJJH_05745 [Endozoicomonadaceae bacterium StTr2]
MSALNFIDLLSPCNGIGETYMLYARIMLRNKIIGEVTLDTLGPDQFGVTFTGGNNLDSIPGLIPILRRTTGHGSFAIDRGRFNLSKAYVHPEPERRDLDASVELFESGVLTAFLLDIHLEVVYQYILFNRKPCLRILSIHPGFHILRIKITNEGEYTGLGIKFNHRGSVYLWFRVSRLQRQEQLRRDIQGHLGQAELLVPHMAMPNPADEEGLTIGSRDMVEDESTYAFVVGEPPSTSNPD